MRLLRGVTCSRFYWYGGVVLYRHSVRIERNGRARSKERHSRLFALSRFVLPERAASYGVVATKHKETTKPRSLRHRRREAYSYPHYAIAFGEAHTKYLRVVVEEDLNDFDAFFRRQSGLGLIRMGGLLAPLDWSTEWHKYPRVTRAFGYDWAYCRNRRRLHSRLEIYQR